MSSFLKVGSNFLNSIAQTLQDISDDEYEINNNSNYIINGKRGILVFNLSYNTTLSSSNSNNITQNINNFSSNLSNLSSNLSNLSISNSNSNSNSMINENQKILHLDYEKGYITIYDQNSSHSYNCLKFNIVKRISIKSVQLEFTSTRQRQPIILHFNNEPDTNQFLKFFIYLSLYSEIVKSSYFELIRETYNNNHNILNNDSLMQAFHLYDINITNENIQSILDLSSLSNKFDYISFFELLLDIPVFNTYDCLIGLLSRIGQNDLTFIPYQESLLSGEVIVKNIHQIRWTFCHNEIDINNLHFNNNKISWYGSLIFTNYRLILYCKQKKTTIYSKNPLPSFFDNITIPLNSILKIQLSNEPISLTHHIRLHILTKDYKLIRIHFISPTRDFNYTHATVFSRQLLNGAFVTSPQRIFCYHYSHNFNNNGWKYSHISYDYNRLNILTDPEWKTISNTRGELIPSYPSLLVVPSKISAEDIQSSINFRCLGRFPVLTYRHNHTQCSLVRSAQPLNSQSQTYGQSDILLLDAYRTSGILNQLRENQIHEDQPTLYIIDARSLLAIAANRAGGKGTEDVGSYINTHLIMCDIDNIHVMRNSIISFSTSIYSSTGLTTPISNISTLSSNMSTLQIPEDNLLKKIENSGWLSHCSRVLSASVYVAEKLHIERSSVLVHCSDGWDRTAQICSLSQILLDPFYRTIEGLAVLIEKDWCSFGYKFQHRCGHSDIYDSPVADQRSPIFFQFLYILNSIMKQMNNVFQYNEQLLIFLSDHLYSGLFGNFLGNNDHERVNILLVQEKTQSIWSYVFDNINQFINPSYQSLSNPIWPYCGVSSINIWERFYMRWNPLCHPKSNNLNEQWKDDWGIGYSSTTLNQNQNNLQTTTTTTISNEFNNEIENDDEFLNDSSVLEK